MNIVILQDNPINESLGLTELVAYAEERGHRFSHFFTERTRSLVSTVAKEAPDLVLIPSDIGGHHWAHRTAALIKANLSLPIVTGGTYPTFYPDKLAADRNFDYAIRGEAEIPFTRLLEGLEAGSPDADIQGVGRFGAPPDQVAQAIEDLDSIPIPRRDLYYKYRFIRNFSLKRFATGRGCYNRCTYCFNPKLRSAYPGGFPYVRRKSVRRVIQEIQAVAGCSPLRALHFSDDIFITSAAWLEEFAERYPRDIGIPFSCNLTVDDLTEEKIRLLHRSGCHAVAIGIESGVESIRRRVLKKIFTNEDAIERGRQLRERGIRIFTFNMIGIPFETLEDVLETCHLNRRLGADHARVNLTFPLPETEMAEHARESGEFGSDAAFDIESFPDFSAREHRGDPPEWIRRYDNLKALFPVIYRHPALYGLVARLGDRKEIKALRIIDYLSVFKETRFFRIRWRDALPYYLNIAPPYRRSKNFVALI